MLLISVANYEWSLIVNYCDVCRKPRHFRFLQRCC